MDLGFGLTRTIAEYEKLKVIGKGTYGCDCAMAKAGMLVSLLPV
jgi:hypothetical protein